MASRRMSSAERARLFKALSDPRRVELLDLVAKHGTLCGTELAERMGISVALLSHHWDVLADAGLIAKTRVGQLRYCTFDIAILREAIGSWKDVGPCHELLPASPAPARKAKKAAARVRAKKPAT